MQAGHLARVYACMCAMHIIYTERDAGCSACVHSTWLAGAWLCVVGNDM